MIMDVYQTDDGKWHLSTCSRLEGVKPVAHLRTGAQECPGGKLIPWPHKSDLCASCFSFICNAEVGGTEELSPVESLVETEKEQEHERKRHPNP